MSRYRVLSDEERALWREVTRHDNKFHAGAYEDEALAEAELSQDACKDKSENKNEAQIAQIIDTSSRKQPSPLMLSNLSIDVMMGTDANTARRLKRGELPIERALDLHGLSRDEAYRLLAKSISDWAMMGVKVCAIITGKGRGDEGVLKRELPHWLNDARLRRYIIAAATAPKKYGGAGAVLLLLRRV